MDGSKQYGQIMGIFLGQLPEALFFPLLLYGTAVGSKHGIVFFKTFHGEGVVANHSQLIEHLAQAGGMPPAGCSYVVYQLVVNEPACRQQFAYSFGSFRSDFERGLEMCLDNELADAMVDAFSLNSLRISTSPSLMRMAGRRGGVSEAYTLQLCILFSFGPFLIGFPLADCHAVDGIQNIAQRLVLAHQCVTAGDENVP